MSNLILLLLISINFVASQQMFRNPILDRNSADPTILRLGDFYYLTLSENTERNLTVYKSSLLTSFREAESIVAYSTLEGFSDLWASEMHVVDGDLYIYFTMTGGGKDHRMYVIKADDPTNPMGNWSDSIRYNNYFHCLEWSVMQKIVHICTLNTRLMPDWDFAAIDGTIFNHGNGRRYFVFATWAFGPLTIYIAPMNSPTQVGFPKIELKRPTEEWECYEGCVKEGPFFIFKNNVSFCVYSVSSTWGPNYALAMMNISYELDPMTVSNWQMPDGPIFYRNDEEEVYTTGHAAFTVSPGNPNMQPYRSILFFEVFTKYDLHIIGD